MSNIDPAWIALIGTLCGGIGLKLLEYWLGKSRVRIDEASKIRDELRIQISQQAERIRELEDEVTKWREAFYDIRDKQYELIATHASALATLRAELEEAKKAPPTVDPDDQK